MISVYAVQWGLDDGRNIISMIAFSMLLESQGRRTF